MNKKKWFKRGLVILIIGGVLAAGSWMLQRAHDKKEAEPKFRLAAVDKGNITQVVLANGTLQPVASINVGVQVSGTVKERLVDFNDRVKAGQVLLRLDPAVYQARLRQGEAQLKSAQASMVLARANMERNQNLLRQGFLSTAVAEQSRRELDVAAANVDLARAQVDAARTDLANSVVRAPIDGVIIKRNIEVGQTVAATFQTPELFQIAQDLKNMQIYANVSEADVGTVRPGQEVRFSVDAFQGREFAGRVAQFRLNPSTTSGVVTYTIVIAVDNQEELLKPGMSAQTRILVASREGVLRIPTAALRFKPDETMLPKAAASASASASATAQADALDDGVLTNLSGGKRIYRVYTLDPDPAKPNKLVQHDVTIGIANTRFTELLSGDLKSGDQVVTRSLVIAPTTGPN